MNIESLKMFLETAKTGSISQAASTLYISQPALSRRLNILETEVGAPLFIRKSSGIELTEAGQRLTIRAEQILSTYDAMIEDMSKISTGKMINLRIGYDEKLKHVLSPLMATILQVKSDVMNPEVRTYGCSISDLCEFYLSRKINIALGARMYLPKSRDSLYALIEPCRFFALVPLDHPLSDRTSVTAEDLLDQQIAISKRHFNDIPEHLYQYLEEKGFHSSQFINCDSWDSARVYALTNSSITFIGSLSNENNLDRFFRRVEIKDFHTDSSDLCAVYRPDAIGAGKFISMLKTNAETFADLK